MKRQVILFLLICIVGVSACFAEENAAKTEVKAPVKAEIKASVKTEVRAKKRHNMVEHKKKKKTPPRIEQKQKTKNK